MILDTIGAMNCYYAACPLLSTVAAFVDAHDLSGFEVGRSTIGSGVGLIIDEYETLSPEKKRAEYHEQFIDVQMVLSGQEHIGYCSRLQSTVTQVYNEEKDVAFVVGALDYHSLYPGNFALFFPHDVHLPGVHVGAEACVVKKAVFKLPVATVRR